MNQSVQQGSIRPAKPENPIAARHAAAFAEIKAIEVAYDEVLRENAELKRTVDKVSNQRDLLDTALSQERIDCKVYQRKLIRLATAMAGIGALTAEAVKIMQDVKEIEEAEAEAGMK